jgi:pyruvate/2-oxoglutarate dehydrogenase complex dihydrolipoamide dehydrogenase (E3) component
VTTLMELGLTAEVMERVIFPHPALNEALKAALTAV